MSNAAKHHGEGFLALVDDAKSRVKQIDIDGFRRMKGGDEEFLLIDVREDNEWAAGHAAGAMHLGKGISSAILKRKFRIIPPRWCFIAAAGSVPRWPRTRCRRWVIRERFHSTAAGAPTPALVCR